MNNKSNKMIEIFHNKSLYDLGVEIRNTMNEKHFEIINIDINEGNGEYVAFVNYIDYRI